MSLKACLNPNASNYMYDANGEFAPNAQIHIPSICEYEVGMNMDEETIAESINSENYTTHEEADIRGSVPTTDRERNRSAYINSQKDQKSNAPLLGLGILAYIFMS
jgi:hypothetical protein